MMLFIFCHQNSVRLIGTIINEHMTISEQIYHFNFLSTISYLFHESITIVAKKSTILKYIAILSIYFQNVLTLN